MQIVEEEDSHLLDLLSFQCPIERTLFSVRMRLFALFSTIVNFTSLLSISLFSSTMMLSVFELFHNLPALYFTILTSNFSKYVSCNQFHD